MRQPTECVSCDVMSHIDVMPVPQRVTNNRAEVRQRERWFTSRPRAAGVLAKRFFE